MCSVYLCLLLLYFWCSLCQLLILLLQLIINNYNETYSTSITSWSESLFPRILSDIYIIIMCVVCICVCYYCISGVHIPTSNTIILKHNETYSISFSSWSESLFPCILSDIYIIIIMCLVCICVCYYSNFGAHYANF